MPRRDQSDTYSIYIDGRWTMDNLSEYSDVFEQCYLAIYGFTTPDGSRIADRFAGMSNVARGGGYGTVNFYGHLKRNVGHQNRLSIRSMKYSSPGWIELFAGIPTAVQVATSVGAIAVAGERAHALYLKIRNGVLDIRKRQREERREELDLQREEIKFMKEGAKELDDFLKLKVIDRVEGLTQHPEATVQLYLGLYRRLERLAEYERNGKAHLPK